MTSVLLQLHNNLQVPPAQDDQAQVTATLPYDLFSDSLRLLDSLTGFVRTVNSKAKLAKSQTDQAKEKLDREAKQNIARYQDDLVQAFDQYTSQGFDRKAAIKQITADLRAEKHCWSSPGLVRSSLVAAGRGGRPGRPRRQL